MRRAARLRGYRWVALAAAILLSPACSGGDGGTTGPINTQPTTPSTPGTMSDAARTYLEQVFNIMKTRSIKRLTINWDAFHSNIFNTASNAQTISGVYPAIREALSMLADGHSSYTPPAGAGATIFVPTRTCRSSGAPNPSISAPVGYVRIGAFSGTTTEAIAFANMIQGIIANGDRDDLVGWIVDLRGNGGGNMWPMVAGVGPILGDGVVGNFIDPTGAVSSWEYRAGASILSGTPVVRVETPYRLRRASPKVAVLLDNGVASSGEAVAIAFRQRPNTRSFGSATCGLSTANSSFTLSDGAVLNLTVAVMADRTRTTYGDQVPPDEPTGDPNDTVQRAIAWLRSP